VLARVDLAPDGTIQVIDNCANRRIVVSFANAWGHCATPPAPQITAAKFDQPPTAGGQQVNLTIDGQNLDAKAKVALGPGLTAQQVTATATGLAVRVAVTGDLPADSITITVVNPDCMSATYRLPVPQAANA
jgi:hypothetical protein